jgi:oligopeptide/dipeptide ABC transporter ATP-binding protein
MAILHRPPLLIADEPTSALDVITQAEILGLFAKLNRELGMAVLYISHDLLSVGQLCHRVAILHEGEIVECAPAAEIFSSPTHPYTRRLMQALPRLEFAEQAPASPVISSRVDFSQDPSSQQRVRVTARSHAHTS